MTLILFIGIRNTDPCIIQELCFSYIGVAAAIGRSVNIPIIIRSLGRDLYQSGLKQDSMFRPGVELLTYIDGNLSSYGLDDPNLLVTEFHLPWWGGPRGKINHTTYLSYSTLTDALAEHRKQLESVGITKRLDTLQDRNKTFYSWHPEVYADLGNPCTRCRLYRAITFGAVDRLRDAEYTSQGLAVANTGESHIGMRRASGFYELYEQVLKKEVDLEQRPIPIPMSGSGPESDTGAGFTKGRKKGKGKAKEKAKANVSQVAERVRTEAEMQLREPGPFRHGESKWTWGVDLNSGDIWEMVRGADKNYQLPHSGYDDDLRTGKLRSSSPIPNPNDIEDPDDPDILFEELSHNPFIRDLQLDEIPLAFSFPTLHYRALGETDSGLEQPPASGSEYTSPSNKEEAIERRGKQVEIGLDSDIIMDVDISASDDDITESRLSAEETPTGLYGLVMPDLPDDSDEDINIGDLGRDTVELSMRAEDRTYGLVVPDSSDEDISVEDFGLVAPDMQSDSGDEIEVGNLGLNSVDQGMWAETMADESDNDSEGQAQARARVWITLPQVNPATGQYTADSFSNVPDEWLD